MNVMNVNNTCKTITLVANTSQTVEVDKSNYVSIYNSGTTVSYVKSGYDTVTADADATFIPPGHNISYERDFKETHMAFFNPDEAAVLHVQLGEGV